MDYFRGFLPSGDDQFTQAEVEFLQENTLYWLTDRTPYEWIPLSYRTHQKVFQFVLSDVSVWFEEYSTPNPLGVVPDPTITKIVKSHKNEARCPHSPLQDREDIQQNSSSQYHEDCENYEEYEDVSLFQNCMK